MASDPSGGSLGLDNMYLGVHDAVTPVNTFGTMTSAFILVDEHSVDSVRVMPLVGVDGVFDGLAATWALGEVTSVVEWELSPPLAMGGWA